MDEQHVIKETELEPRRLDDDNCTKLAEVERLREEVRKLAALVRTDGLTGLFNYRYFSEVLGLEMERTRRSGQPTCLIMCDLDHFKSINDIHGHEVGNVVLTQISSLIRNTIRRLDIPCRYGGEEFALTLPDTNLRQGVQFANRLRLIIEHSPISSGNLVLKIEASFGVHVYNYGDQSTEKEFIDQVDGFLYMAKQEGRNRVCHASYYEKLDGFGGDKKRSLGKWL